MADARPEELAIDDADPAADIEERRARVPTPTDEVEQHARRPIGPLFSVTVAILLGGPPVEDRCEVVAPAGVHRRRGYTSAPARRRDEPGL